jgi:hypothetical protein
MTTKSANNRPFDAPFSFSRSRGKDYTDADCADRNNVLM